MFKISLKYGKLECVFQPVSPLKAHSLERTLSGEGQIEFGELTPGQRERENLPSDPRHVRVLFAGEDFCCFCYFFDLNLK